MAIENKRLQELRDAGFADVADAYSHDRRALERVAWIVRKQQVTPNLAGKETTVRARYLQAQLAQLQAAILEA